MTYTPPEGVTIGPFTAHTLPASFSAPADAAVTYKIYGTSEGAGVETESGEPAGFKIPILNTSGVTENLFDYTAQDTDNGFEAHRYINRAGGTSGSANHNISEYIEIEPDTVYSLCQPSAQSAVSMCFYNSEKSVISAAVENNAITTITSPASAKYVRLTITIADQSEIMLVPGSTAPSSYIPHRYESNYDLFVGDSKLYADEYLDFDSQKVYKYVDGVLTPQDPPLPFPTISTYKDENTLSSTETLGDIELTGDWLAIMGSTEDESIDIGFTVDAEEYIAYVTVDDGPSIQVSDTITMPSSADSFSLKVVAWGREQYTDTVYNALS